MSTHEAQNPQSSNPHSDSSSQSEVDLEENELATRPVAKPKIKMDQVSKLLNKFKAKEVTISHILGDLTRFDIESCLDEVAKATVDYLIQDQSAFAMNEVL